MMKLTLSYFALPAILLSALGSAPVARGQKISPASSASSIHKAESYKSEPVVIEKLLTVYRYAADGTGTKTITGVTRIQSEAAARQYGIISIPYQADNEQVEMRYLRVRKPGGALVSTSSQDAQDVPAQVTRLAPFYSDLRQKQFPVRSLSVGDTLEYEVVIHLSKAQAPGQFWGVETLRSSAVALDERIEIHIPAARSVIVISPKHKPEITESGTERIYRWQGSQLKPTVPAAGAAKDEKAKSDPDGGLPEIAWTSFANWAEVGEWYRSLSADRVNLTPDIRSKAAALIAGATTDDEKIRRIYDYVSGNIRYVGVDFGIGRYQPHLASEVLANQYGDCKDKHTLLTALLAAAGYQASPVLIGAGIKFDREVPAPSSFNHVITALQVDNRRIWLDSTTEVAPFGMLSLPLRDKDALLIPAAGKPVLVKTPATLPFPAFDQFDSKASLDKDGNLTGHFNVVMRGDLELPVRWVLHQTTAAQWSQMGQAISSNLGFSGTVTQFAPDKVEDTTEPLHYTYDYELKGYGDWPTRRIVPLIPDALFAATQLDKKPEEPIALGNPRVETARSTIHLPDGYTAVLPDAVHLRSGFGSYDVTYSWSNGDLICENRLAITSSSIPASDWEQYNAFSKQVKDNTGIYIQLTRGNNTAPIAASAKSPASRLDDVRAAVLVREAYDEIGKRQLPDAELKLNQAQKINSEQSRLWSTYGYLAYQRLQFAPAVEDYEKEIALYPDAIGVYGSMASAQLHLKQRTNAIQTLRAALVQKPDNAGLILWLASLLTAEKRYPEALSLLQSATLRTPGNKNLLLQLGKTQYAAGRPEEAEATLHMALENATDPVVLNDAAYELALHHVDLPLAEASVRKGLTTLEAGSQKFTLDNVTGAELASVRLISFLWDTLGWIEFEKGQISEAEPLLTAAWLTSQHSEVGYHLGRVYQKEGKALQALNAYEQARAVLGSDGTISEMGDLMARIAALQKNGVRDSTILDVHNALSEQRSYTLQLLTKQQASAAFFVLLSPGKVEAVRFIDGSPELQGMGASFAPLLLRAMMNGTNRTPLFPLGSAAKSVRRGVLSCSPLLHNCTAVLLLPQNAWPEPKVQPASNLQVAAKQ